MGLEQRQYYHPVLTDTMPFYYSVPYRYNATLLFCSLQIQCRFIILFLTDTIPFLSYIELAILNYIQKKIYSHKKDFLRKDFDIEIMKDIGLLFQFALKLSYKIGIQILLIMHTHECHLLLNLGGIL